jgi:hypothetical protein
MKTPFTDKCDILSDVWMNYRDTHLFATFVEHYDLGMPLSHFLSESIVLPTPLAEKYVNETWEKFIEHLGIEEQEDFPAGHDVEEILAALLLDENEDDGYLNLT